MNLFSPPPADLSRRRFVQGVAIGGPAAGLGLLRPANVWALTNPGHPTVLSGTDFALDIAETPVNYTGVTRLATTLNGDIPGPILRWKEGTTVNLRVTNRLRVPTSIHWHGIILPFQEDGVPGISFDGIAPGETFLYRFQVRQSGTFWYHSHSRFQEQTGLYGPLVIEPAGNWTGIFRPGETIRLRFINGSAQTIFDVRIPGLKMTVISADGQDVEPVSVDEFRISVAETYDVVVEPQEERAYTLFAQSIDRTGYARGTLAPRAGMDQGAMPGMTAAAAPVVRHARTEYAPGVDMHVDMPRTNLDDPGIGLRNNGRRVLTYADLHTIGGPIDTREPGREIEWRRPVTSELPAVRRLVCGRNTRCSLPSV